MVESVTPSSNNARVRVQSPSSPLARINERPWRRLRGRTSPRKTSPNKAQRLSRFLIPRSYSTPATFILVKSGLAGQILSTRTLSGLRIGGRLTNRPCMDSAEGDSIVRFRAPGSILITRDYFRPLSSSLQGLLNRGVWKRQPRQRPSSQESPPVERLLRPLIPHSYSTPRVAISSDLP